MRRVLIGGLLLVTLLAVAPRDSEASSVTAEIGLNLRTGPGLEYAVQTVMPYGSWVDVLSGPYGDGWYEVVYAGVWGYAHGSGVGPGGGGWAAPGGGAPGGGAGRG